MIQIAPIVTLESFCKDKSCFSVSLNRHAGMEVCLGLHVEAHENISFSMGCGLKIWFQDVSHWHAAIIEK